jgi:hypothetical protein
MPLHPLAGEGPRNGRAGLADGKRAALRRPCQSFQCGKRSISGSKAMMPPVTPRITTKAPATAAT